MRLSVMAGVAACGAVLLASVATGQVQRRAPGTAADDKVGVNIALQAGGAAYQFSGRASCTHLPKGSIYGVVGQNWQVSQNDGPRSMSLTLWRPANGSPDMFTLYVANAGQSYNASTVKDPSAAAAPAKGSGTVTLAPAGNGGTFTIQATAANGAKISGTVKCDAFTAPMAVAGD